jgi:hypothetical protein
MADKVKARKELELCSTELFKYQNLNSSGLIHSELIAIDNVMIRLKEQIKNLRVVMYD